MAIDLFALALLLSFLRGPLANKLIIGVQPFYLSDYHNYKTVPPDRGDVAVDIICSHAIVPDSTN